MSNSPVLPYVCFLSAFIRSASRRNSSRLRQIQQGVSTLPFLFPSEEEVGAEAGGGTPRSLYS
jgi:hypothetical protein